MSALDSFTSQLSLPFFIEFNCNNYKFPLREKILRKFLIFNFFFVAKLKTLNRWILFVPSNPKIATRENDIEQITFRDLVFAISIPHSHVHIPFPRYRENKICFFVCLHRTHFIFSPRDDPHSFPLIPLFFSTKESEIFIMNVIYGSSECCSARHAYGELFGEYWTFCYSTFCFLLRSS